MFSRNTIVATVPVRSIVTKCLSQVVASDDGKTIMFVLVRVVPLWSGVRFGSLSSVNMPVRGGVV